MMKAQSKKAKVTDASDKARDRMEGEPGANRRAPGEEAIARLAYQLWLERGSPDGSAEDDWFRAEEALRASETGGHGTSRPLIMNAGVST
jgi:hypothetical protein